MALLVWSLWWKILRTEVTEECYVLSSVLGAFYGAFFSCLARQLLFLNCVATLSCC